ncbi:MAG: tetraacyldisaccharide 4'-kinase [Prevotella sp.]|nr:tetraacyldisaccharide 4'-kinase [Prevotella sp.]
MEGDYIKIKEALLPLSWLYGAAVGIRNFCFDVGLLKSQAFDVPVIAVGNITVGGTGKTPHVEYLVKMLREKFHVAVLSRGYKRKTSGYLLATNNSTMNDIGDEPMQMKSKFPDISVAVDKKRVRGIQRLTDDDEQLDVVLLDDAFQHRYVKPGINILLVDYHRLIIYDKLLPAGRLRESMKGKNRADIVIVTKCPKSLKPMEFRLITKAMNLYPYQHLFFTTLHYADLRPIFAQASNIALSDLKGRHVLLLTGIASPRQMQEDLAPYASNITPLTFADHHDFSQRDVQRINDAFAQMTAEGKLIVTTEKDATRLQLTEGLSDEVRRHLYALPVDIQFIQEEQAQRFNDIITGYVQKNSRNSILVTGKEEHRPRTDKRATSKPHTITFK